jgi:hypothetical protein
MPGAQRTRSLVRKVESTRVSHHRFAEHSGIPCTNGLTAYSELSPAIGLVVAVLDVTGKRHRQVDASVETSGPHGFAVCGWRFVRHESIRT